MAEETREEHACLPALNHDTYADIEIAVKPRIKSVTGYLLDDF